jgi:hypothetical protein
VTKLEPKSAATRAMVAARTSHPVRGSVECGAAGVEAGAESWAVLIA